MPGPQRQFNQRGRGPGQGRGGAAGGRGPGQGRGGGGGERRGRGGGFDREQEDKEFDQATLELSRVTRVTKGGKRMRFRALIIIGDRKGRVGFGLAKGADVSIAINKAARQARKNVITIPLVNESIPHRSFAKDGAAKVLLMPAPKGSGVIAGGPVRVVMELAGVPNISSKMQGGKNKVNNVRATFAALGQLRRK